MLTRILTATIGLVALLAIAAVVAMQAVLRIGAVYVPIAAGMPPARTAAILGDCGVVCVVTDRDSLASLTGGDTF